MSSFDSLVQQAHALACIRNPESNAMGVGVVLAPTVRADKAEAVPPESLEYELAERATWSAGIRLGGGKWDSRTGWGRTPSEAVEELSVKLSEAISDTSERYRKLEARASARRVQAVTAESEGAGLPGFVAGSDGRLEPTPEQAAFMKGYTAGARSMGELTDGVSAERAYHAQVALLDGLVEQLGAAASLKEALLAVREARLNLPPPNKK